MRLTKQPLVLTLIAVVLAYWVVGLGVFTRLVDAGLGCPDWPGCYGHLLWPDETHEIERAEALFPDAPVDTDKTWPEMVHRYFAGSLGLLVLGIAVVALRERRNGGAETPIKLPLGLLVLVIVQAAFGMWTVTLKLWPQVVTAHLLGGFATLSLLWLLLLRQYYSGFTLPSIKLPPLIPKVAAVTLVVVITQIAIGGWTTSNYAALACTDFPTCHGEWVPSVDLEKGFNVLQEIGPNYLGGIMDNDARTAIHFTHRIGALVTALSTLLLAFLLWKTGTSVFKKLAILLTGMLIVQLVLGISNILLVLPLHVAVSHNLVGAFLLLSVVTINYQIYRCKYREERSPSKLGNLSAI